MENLFSYGTLQLEKVRLDTFGRQLQGQADALVGFKQSFVKIEDAAVIASSGLTEHPVILQTDNPADVIDGTVFEISLAELLRADEYEVEDYKRVSVVLRSGKKAWVYVRA